MTPNPYVFEILKSTIDRFQQGVRHPNGSNTKWSDLILSIDITPIEMNEFVETKCIQLFN
ncbi:hypothetical protein ACFE6N_15155 [Pedobacter sp. BG31]|uniref:hypothetical protein n=1 Tax=Pedobacter sp. BG31 TaxID=3349697 RepID=UPI0035F4D8C0